MKWAKRTGRDGPTDKRVIWYSEPVGPYSIRVYESGHWYILRGGEPVKTGRSKDGLEVAQEVSTKALWEYLVALKQEAETTLDILEEVAQAYSRHRRRL